MMQCKWCGTSFQALHPLKMYCSEMCLKEKKRNYDKAYCLKHSDRKRRNARDWYEKNKDRARDSMRRRRASNIEKKREYDRRYYLKNQENLRIKSRDAKRKIGDLVDVLRKEMPELLKEFGL